MTRFRSFQLWFSISCLLFLTLGIHAQSAKYKEGEHFFVLPDTTEETAKESDSDSGDEIEVIEFFSYSCKHCYRLQPFVKNWLERKPEDVVLRREHVIFNTQTIPLARAYYMAEELKVLSEIHDKIFEALHRHNMNISSESVLMQLFKGIAEVDSETFKEKYWSEETQDRIRAGNRKVSAWRILATPTLVVGGKYLVTTESAGSQRRMFQVVDFLAEKIRKESKATKS